MNGLSSSSSLLLPAADISFDFVNNLELDDSQIRITVTGTILLANSTRLIAYGGPLLLQLWDYATGKRLMNYDIPEKRGHGLRKQLDEVDEDHHDDDGSDPDCDCFVDDDDFSIMVVAAAVPGNKAALFSSTRTGNLLVHHLETGVPLRQCNPRGNGAELFPLEFVTAVAAHPTYAVIAVAGFGGKTQHGTILLLDANTFEVLLTVTQAGTTDHTELLFVGSDELLAAGVDGVVYRLRYTADKTCETLLTYRPRDLDGVFTPPVRVGSIALSPDRRQLAVAARTSIRVFDFETGEVVCEFNRNSLAGTTLDDVTFLTFLTPTMLLFLNKNTDELAEGESAECDISLMSLPVGRIVARVRPVVGNDFCPDRLSVAAALDGSISMCVSSSISKMVQMYRISGVDSSFLKPPSVTKQGEEQQGGGGEKRKARRRQRDDAAAVVEVGEDGDIALQKKEKTHKKKSLSSSKKEKKSKHGKKEKKSKEGKKKEKKSEAKKSKKNKFDSDGDDK